MLTLKLLTSSSAELPEITALYDRAFPENERRPFLSMLDDPKKYHEVFAAYDKTVLCGFVCLLTFGEICHILYFSIFENLRNRNYGSQALREISRRKSGKKIIVDIERERPDAENNAQRRKRKEFYLRNGYVETSVRYSWRNESYEILSFNGKLTNQEFHSFWQHLDPGRRSDS